MKGKNMSIIKFNPAQRSLSRLSDFWDDDFFAPLDFSSVSNKLDLYETEDEITVKANVAGMKVEDVDLTFEKDTLWIKAEKTEEKDEKDKKYYSKSLWSYSYRVVIPAMLDHSVQPDATIEDGILTVKFKKSEHTKPRKLTIKSK